MRLVLSTLHANEAVGAVVRLLDMGITPVLDRVRAALRDRAALREALCERAGSRSTRRRRS